MGDDGKDLLYSGAGNDGFEGGGGNDLLDGGPGRDIARLGDAIENYTWHRQADGSWLIEHHLPSGFLGDGTDVLRGIEVLSFPNDERPSHDSRTLLPLDGA